jgi:hypothetical protein
MTSVRSGIKAVSLNIINYGVVKQNGQCKSKGNEDKHRSRKKLVVAGNSLKMTSVQ